MFLPVPISSIWLCKLFQQVYTHFAACAAFDKIGNPALETVYGFPASREDAPLRMYKYCGKLFFAIHGRTEFCSGDAETGIFYIKVHN